MFNFTNTYVRTKLQIYVLLYNAYKWDESNKFLVKVLNSHKGKGMAREKKRQHLLACFLKPIICLLIGEPNGYVFTSLLFHTEQYTNIVENREYKFKP